MSDDAAATKPKTKTPKKAAKAKAPANHPTYKEMVRRAIVELKERNGSSRAAILKYILKNFKVGDNENKVNASLKLALKGGVKNGTLKQTKGVGASGSFRANKEEKPKKASKLKAAKPKSPKKKAAAKPKAEKAEKPKKAASPKKKAAKKTPKKPAAKKPAAKKPAAKKSPAKKAAKKPAAKKPAAKKATKKAAK